MNKERSVFVNWSNQQSVPIRGLSVNLSDETHTGFLSSQRASWTWTLMKVRDLSVIYLPVALISKLTPDFCPLNVPVGPAR